MSIPISQMRKLRHRRRGVRAEPLPTQPDDPRTLLPSQRAPTCTQNGRQLPRFLGSPPPRKTLWVECVQGGPQSCPPAGRYSQKAEDDDTGKGDEQEEGQGAQDGRDDDHASASPAGPRVDR